MSDDNSELISPTEATGAIVPVKQAPWHYWELLISFAISLLLQATFLPCMCSEGTVKTAFGGVFDILILCRIIIANVLNEQGKGWIFYLVLTLTSAIWITVLVHLLFVFF